MTSYKDIAFEKDSEIIELNRKAGNLYLTIFVLSLTSIALLAVSLWQATGSIF